MSLAQLVKTMHDICKISSSNPDHHKKIDIAGTNLFIEIFVKYLTDFKNSRILEISTF